MDYGLTTGQTSKWNKLLFTEIWGFLNPQNCKTEQVLIVKDLHTILVALYFATVGFAMIRKYIGF